MVKRPERLVVVGSSAGGIEALSELVTGLGPEPVAAYVIAQHLSPTHTSPLAEILARQTPFDVRVARDGDALSSPCHSTTGQSGRRHTARADY